MKEYDTNNVKCDYFMADNETMARHAFRECYRHHRYKILSIVKK